MHDPFPSIWGDKIAALPPLTRVSLVLTPNTYPPDDVTCVACHGERPEWLVTMRSRSATIIGGLHEECRRRSDKGGGAKGGG